MLKDGDLSRNFFRCGKDRLLCCLRERLQRHPAVAMDLCGWHEEYSEKRGLCVGVSDGQGYAQNFKLFYVDPFFEAVNVDLRRTDPCH